MKLRNTFLLVLITLGLLVGVIIFEKHTPSTRRAAQMRFEVADFDPAKITKIVLVNDDERIELGKEDGIWFLQSPIKDNADGTLPEAIMDSLLNLRPTRVINEEKQEVDPKVFGVNKSNVSLELFGEGAPPKMLFGKNSAVEGQVYARLVDSNRIYVIATDLRNLVTKKTDDFRDRTLMSLHPEQAKKMVIRTSGGEIELKKENEHWQIDKPIRARGNDQLIGKMLTQITNLKAKGFVGGDETPRMGEQLGTVALYSETSDQPTSLSLVDAPDLPEGVYAKLSTRNSLFILNKVVSGLFKAKPNDLRDRFLLRVNLDWVDRIHIEPAGKPKLLLARDQENWKIDGKPADAGKMKRFLECLLSQKVVSFVADTGTDLDKYGLKAPLVRITLSSYASENTPESNAGEKEITTLLLGRIENGEIYAKLEEEPFVVSVDKAILDVLPSQW